MSEWGGYPKKVWIVRVTVSRNPYPANPKNMILARKRPTLATGARFVCVSISTTKLVGVEVTVCWIMANRHVTALTFWDDED